MGSLEKKKILTAILLLPPMILILFLGPTVLLLVVLLATFFGIREYYALALPDSRKIERWTGTAMALLISVLTSLGDPQIVSLSLVILLLLLLALFMGSSHTLQETISTMGMTLFGILYISFLLAHVSLIRNATNGKLWVMFLIATVWASDVFAFFTGSLLGRHKLYPRISPKKSYEGLAGAIGGSILVALIFAGLFMPGLQTSRCVLLAILISVLGQFGDLTESMLKRSARVKDSGALIPGHGGMLDRLDSFLFTAPALHYSLLLFLQEGS